MALKLRSFFLLVAVLSAGLVWTNAPARAGALDDMGESIATDDLGAGLAAHGRGDHQGAIKRYTQAIDSGSLSKANLAIAHNNRGNAYDDEGDTASAVADYDRAIRLDAAFTEAYFNRAYALYRLGRMDAALRDFDRAIQLDPLNASAYFNRSFTHAAKGNYKKAVADVEKALELSPHNSKYRDQLADWKAASGGKR